MADFNLRRVVTDKVIEGLHRAQAGGGAPWECPWQKTNPHPVNGSSGHRYRGVNVVLLWMAGAIRGYDSNEWFTFKQAMAMGGMVRTGEHSEMVVFAGTRPLKNPHKCPKCKREGIKVTHRAATKTGWPLLTGSCGCTFEAPTYHDLRYFSVFNRNQIDGLPPSRFAPPEPMAICDRNELIEWWARKALGAVIEEHGDRAYYSRGTDGIVLPPMHRFYSTDQYYATMIHEVGHWTGHDSRMARTFGIGGDPAYAFEELVAEMFAAFKCADFGLSGELRHPEYIAHWIKRLQDDERALFQAIALAEEACDWTTFITGLGPGGVAEEEEERVNA